MGLIHSHASKRLANSNADLIDEQAKITKIQRKALASEAHHLRIEQAAEAAGDSILRQPTLRLAIAKTAERYFGR